MCQIIIVRLLIFCETVFSLFRMSEFLFFCTFIFQNEVFKKQLKRKSLKSHGMGPRTQRTCKCQTLAWEPHSPRLQRREQSSGQREAGDAAEKQASPSHIGNILQAEFFHRWSFCCKE